MKFILCRFVLAVNFFCRCKFFFADANFFFTLQIFFAPHAKFFYSVWKHFLHFLLFSLFALLRFPKTHSFRCVTQPTHFCHELRGPYKWERWNLAERWWPWCTVIGERLVRCSFGGQGWFFSGQKLRGYFFSEKKPEKKREKNEKKRKNGKKLSVQNHLKTTEFD